MVGEKTNPISRSCVNGGANPHLILLGVIFGGLDFNNTLWVLKDSGQALNENGLKMNRKLAVFCESATIHMLLLALVMLEMYHVKSWDLCSKPK